MSADFSDSKGRNLPSDWPGGGASALRALVAEAVTADHSWIEDGASTIWKGGNTRGLDVTSDHTRRDAKAVCRDREGWITLCRPGGKPYDPERVDRITLVEVVTVDTGWHVDLSSVRLAATAVIGDVWDIPVVMLNELMPAPGRYRNALLPTDVLSSWRRR